MNIIDVRVGDKLIWHRAGQTDHCEVVKIDDEACKALLKIKG